MKNQLTTIGVILGALLFCGLAVTMIFVSNYNKPMTLKLNAEEQMGNVAVYLQSQADVVSNAQAGFAKVAELDEAMVNAYIEEAKAIGGMLDPYCSVDKCDLPEDPAERQKILDAMESYDNSSRNFIAFVAQHAELRTADTFDTLMIAVEGQANRVSTERRTLNAMIGDLKEHCINLPGSIFCGMRGVTGNEFGFYTVDDSKQEMPTPNY